MRKFKRLYWGYFATKSQHWELSGYSFSTVGALLENTNLLKKLWYLKNNYDIVELFWSFGCTQLKVGFKLETSFDMLEGYFMEAFW